MGYSRPIVDVVEGENPIITYIKEMIFKKNKSINAVTIGETGSGKSWGTLKLCTMLDPSFTIEGNWFFKAAPFMRAINDYYNKDNDPQKGKIWVLDEAGVDLNNLNFMDDLNKGLNAFFQTARHRNYIFIATVPYLRFLSKGVRTLMNFEITAKGYNSDNKTVLLPRIMQYNGEIDKTYKKMVMVRSRGDPLHRCNCILVGKPPVKVRREYERNKMKFTSDLFGGIASRIEHFERKQIEKYVGKKLNLSDETILEKLKKGLTIPVIANEMDIGESQVKKNIVKMRNFGLTIVPIKKSGATIRYNVYDPRPQLIQGVQR